jgi:hypothetical protein
MAKKKPSKIPPPPPDLPSAISPYEKESSEADAKLRDMARTKREELEAPKRRKI